MANTKAKEKAAKEKAAKENAAKEKASRRSESKHGEISDSDSDDSPVYEDSDVEEVRKEAGARPRSGSGSTGSSVVSSVPSKRSTGKGRGTGAGKGGGGLPPNDPATEVPLPRGKKPYKTHWGMKVNDIGEKRSVLSGNKEFTFGGSTKNMLLKVPRKSPSAQGTNRIVHINRHRVGKFNADKSFKEISNRSEVQKRLKEITN